MFLPTYLYNVNRYTCYFYILHIFQVPTFHIKNPVEHATDNEY